MTDHPPEERSPMTGVAPGRRWCAGHHYPWIPRTANHPIAVREELDTIRRENRGVSSTARKYMAGGAPLNSNFGQNNDSIPPPTPCNRGNSVVPGSCAVGIHPFFQK